MSQTSVNMAAKSMSQPTLVRGPSVEINARAIDHATKDKIIMINNFKHQDDWISNSERNRCHICTKNFGAFRRKHHCRVCGEIVCGSCTLKKQVMLPMVGQTEAKVCVTCVLEHCNKSIEPGMAFEAAMNASMPSPASFSVPSSVSSRDGRGGGRSEMSRNNTHLVHSPDVMSAMDPDYGEEFDYPLDFDWEHPWPKPPIVADEKQRLEALRAFDILDTPQEDVFDIICDLVSKSLNCPIAAVSFIDHDRQWFKASVGLIQEEIPRNVSFCAHVLHTKQSIVVPDTMQDKRFDRNPLVTGRAGIRFYAASPIIVPGSNVVLGTVFVFDNHPRPRDQFDMATLERLAGVAMKNLEDRRATYASQPSYDQRPSGATDRSSVVTALSQEGYQVQSPKPQSSSHSANGPTTPQSRTPTASNVPTASSPTSSALSSTSATAPSAVSAAARQTPSTQPTTAVTTTSPGAPPGAPGSTEVAAMPKMETMLMDLLSKTTVTQQQLAKQQGSMYATIAGHSQQIDKLAEAVARMEAKLVGDQKPSDSNS
ncbi:hypothetical protein LEN26_017932 [Aphanomyces euteiches]|nr:hypothetical protein LEN26_017932 [Aphanomyces euteiches]KAH9109716.1 hypothetical protein AeMF1_015260 [Aphanomyces euteiches]KAH9186265.1 hypothetical protein AeNC1_011762 [Aphanomyces euteiches]